MASGTLHQVGTGQSGASFLRRLGAVLVERAWLILLCVVVGGGGGALYLWRAPKTYETFAEVAYKEDQLLRLLDPQRAGGDSGRIVEFQLAALQRSVSGSALLRSVAESLQLASLERFSLGETGPEALENAVARLRGAVRVEVPPVDVVMKVWVRETSPDLAARIANSVVSELIAENTRERHEMLKNAQNLLSAALEKSKGELQGTVAPTNATATDPSAGVLEASRLAEELQALIERVATNRVRLAQATAIADAIRGAGNDLSKLLDVPALGGTPQIKAVRDNYSAKLLAFEETAQRYKEKHEKYIAARAELDRATDTLRKALEQAKQRAEVELADAQAATETARALFEQKKAEASRLAERSSPVGGTVISERLKGIAEFHDRVMQRLQDLNLTAEILVSPLKISRQALAPVEPSGPDPVRVVGTGLLGGLVAGLLVCLVFGLGDTSLRTVDEAERVLGLPVLSVVPRLRDSDSEMAAAEGFRSLRTSITVSSKGKEPRLILFTSTSPDEGKTFCALNFAVGLAQQGHKTVLIECDLRRPMAAPSLTLVNVDAPGVSDFLKAGAAAAAPASSSGRKEAGLSFAEIRRKKTEASEPAPDAPSPAGDSAGSLAVEEVVQRTEVANLFFVAAGKPVANPTELLSRPRFEDLLNGLLQRYDRIVLDSAPVLGVSETLLLANRVQGVCFVIRGRNTPRRAVMRAVEVLRRADAPILGAVLNGIIPKRSDPYGQDYYYHRSSGRGG